MVRVEFTIEPFVEGQPGPHVTAAVAAVERHGVGVEFGPFGSTCEIELDSLAPLVGDLLTAAYANGATHVHVHVEREAS